MASSDVVAEVVSKVEKTPAGHGEVETSPASRDEASALWSKAQDRAAMCVATLTEVSKTHGLGVSFGLEAQAVDAAWGRAVKLKSATFEKKLNESLQQVKSTAERIVKVRFFTASDEDMQAKAQIDAALQHLAMLHDILEKIDEGFGKKLRAEEVERQRIATENIQVAERERRQPARGGARGFVCPSPLRRRGSFQASAAETSKRAAPRPHRRPSPTKTLRNSSAGLSSRKIALSARRMSMAAASFKQRSLSLIRSDTESGSANADGHGTTIGGNGNELKSGSGKQSVSATAEEAMARRPVVAAWPKAQAGSSMCNSSRVKQAARLVRARTARAHSCRIAVDSCELDEAASFDVLRFGSVEAAAKWRAETAHAADALAAAAPVEDVSVKGAKVDASASWAHLNYATMLDARCEYTDALANYEKALFLLRENRSLAEELLNVDADSELRAAVCAHGEGTKRSDSCLINAAEHYLNAAMQMALKKPHELCEARAHLGLASVAYERALRHRRSESFPQALERSNNTESATSSPPQRIILCTAEENVAAARIQAQFRGRCVRRGHKRGESTRVGLLQTSLLHTVLALNRFDDAMAGGDSMYRAEAHAIAATVLWETGSFVASLRHAQLASRLVPSSGALARLALMAEHDACGTATLAPSLTSIEGRAMADGLLEANARLAELRWRQTVSAARADELSSAMNAKLSKRRNERRLANANAMFASRAVDARNNVLSKTNEVRKSRAIAAFGDRGTVVVCVKRGFSLPKHRGILFGDLDPYVRCTLILPNKESAPSTPSVCKPCRSGGTNPVWSPEAGLMPAMDYPGIPTSPLLPAPLRHDELVGNKDEVPQLSQEQHRFAPRLRVELCGKQRIGRATRLIAVGDALLQRPLYLRGRPVLVEVALTGAVEGGGACGKLSLEVTAGSSK